MNDSLLNGTIRIVLFARLREQAGWAERQWSTAGASDPIVTPRQVWQLLELPEELSNVRIAINQQFAEPDTPLQPGDELAFLPPISGG